MPEISRRQFAVYLVAVVLVVVLGGRALRADVGGALPGTGPAGAFGAAAEPGPSPTPPGATGATGPGVEMGADETPVLVHVAGAVARPGVYELPGDARIRDAVEEAGGGRKGADLDALNLAAKISDGQQVLVRRHAPAGASPAGASAAADGAASAPGASVGGGAAGTGAVPAGAAAASGGGTGATVAVNQADATQLEALNGVGPAIAAKIVDWRTRNGPFKTVDDLALVPGIGPRKLEAMRAQVVV